jgi:hypothetical protein
MTDLELREKIVHIDQMLADIDRTRADHLRTIADMDRKRQEIWYQPIVAVTSGMTAGAALFAAGAVLMKAFGAT